MLTSLLFFASNGHLVIIEILIQGFYVLPVAVEWQSMDRYFHLVSVGSWMFASALFIALPAVTAILIINFSFGVITRAAPQMNVFTLGFPFTMMMGLFIVWISLTGFLPQYQSIVSECLIMLRAMVTA
jgi:flagellar biosynthetic protein FliR